MLKKTIRPILTLAVLALLSSVAYADGESPLYSTELSGELTTGQQGEITLTVKPGEGYKWNKGYPAKLVLENGDIVQFAQTEYRKTRGEITGDDSASTVIISATGSRAGEETVKATMNFSVCNDLNCKLLREELTLTITVR